MGKAATKKKNQNTLSKKKSQTWEDFSRVLRGKVTKYLVGNKKKITICGVFKVI